MYERFTDRSRKVMQLANQFAQKFNHEQINPLHVLMGLLKEGVGVGCLALQNLDVNLTQRLAMVENEMHPRTPMITMGKLPQTEECKDVIRHAIDAAVRLQNNYVGTEHVLLGLMRDRLIQECMGELTYDAVLAEIKKVQQGTNAPPVADETVHQIAAWATKVAVIRAEEPEADLPIVIEEGGGRVDGVGVLLYPECVRGARDSARETAALIRKGSIVGLPSTRGPDGNFLWDFKIVGGDPGQVQIKRSGE